MIEGKEEEAGGRGRGESREGKLSWQAAYGSYFAPFRQLSVAEAPQEVARVACCSARVARSGPVRQFKLLLRNCARKMRKSSAAAAAEAK